MGWQWQRTPARHGPRPRVDRHWLLAVATLWVLAHGTRVEEARLRGLAPGRVRRIAPDASGRGPDPDPEPVSAGPVPGPAAAAPRLCLGPGGLAAAPAGTGPARRNCNGWTPPTG